MSKDKEIKFETEHKIRKPSSKNPHDNLLDGVKIWVEFWRKNPHRFVLDYLQIAIFPFQMILIYMMNLSDIFVFIATRGLGKTFLTAIFCVTRCILYPGTKIILASGNKKQAGEVISKIAELRHNSCALDKEIDELKQSLDNQICTFKNGSFIKATTSGDGARGARGNVLIVDEFRLVKEKDVNMVLKPMLTSPRRPGYLSLEPWKSMSKKDPNIYEPNKELYLSSAYYRSSWVWDKFSNTVMNMCEGKKQFTCAIPYICSIDHGILLRDKVEQDRRDLGEVSFLMEYCCIFYGESEHAYFKSDELNICRVLNKAFMPLDSWEYRDEETRKKMMKQMPKVKGEFRIIGADIAIEEGKQNDNSIYTLMRLIPDGDRFIREVVYMESHNGVDPEPQAIRLKQLFYDFEADKMIVDVNGNGGQVLTTLQQSQYDEERDVHYEKFQVYNKNGEVDFELGEEGLPVIYAVKANEKINNDMALSLKKCISNKTLRLLIDDVTARHDHANEQKFILDGNYASRILLPYLELTHMIHETINLEYEFGRYGNVRLYEVGKNRKDRYSSLAYTNLLADSIELDEIKKSNKETIGFLFLT